MLLASGAWMLAPAALAACAASPRYKVRSVDNAQRGHLLRDFKFPDVESFTTTDIVIAGAGISGLTAAYYLAKAGHTQFRILNLDEVPGGNSTSGSNAITSYPLGAHYLPLVNEQNKVLQEFLHEHAIIRDWTEEGIPVYEEAYLCAEPNERLYLDGYWQDSLIPAATIEEKDRMEIRAFLDSMEFFRRKTGRDGKYWFDIPLDKSSVDEENRALDTITMYEWVAQQGWSSQYLMWYIDYCCRDDYGTRADRTSAWAGIHYFAGRKAKASHAESDAVLTWPEGNHFLVKCLTSGIPAERFQNNTIVFHIEEDKDGVEIHYYDIVQEKSFGIRCKKCIDALPLFVHKRMASETTQRLHPLLDKISYAPWLVANLSLNSTPVSGNGAPLSWDNVIFNQQSLGYVNACHQIPASQVKAFVLTYYKALAAGEPRDERMAAHSTTPEVHAEEIVSELARVHPGFREQVTEIEIKLWGHAMLRPIPHAIWTERLKRNDVLDSFEHIVFAHTDHSGISIFEEAFHQGWTAAQNIHSKVQSV